MQLRDLVSSQREFDDRHGWNPIGGEPQKIMNAVERDLVGLLGEIGEFANVLKKIQLLERFPEKMETEWRHRQTDLGEEVVDALIYLVRIASHLNIDLEQSYIEKMRKNAQKYRDFELR